MSVEAIIDEIARYREWVEAQPFGAPIDVDAYREHLLVEELRRREGEKDEA